MLLVVPALEARPWPDAAWVEYENALTAEYRTPHTKWAKPYAHGRIRVLFFGLKDSKQWMIWGPGTRFAVELMQGFDIDGDAVLVDPEVDKPDPRNPEQLGVYGGEIGRQRLGRLLEESYDGYVFGDEKIFAHLPDTAKKKILDAVRKGAGLMVKSGICKALAQEAKPLKLRPAVTEGLEIDCFSIGKGRVAVYRSRSWNLWHRKPAEIYDLAPLFGVDLHMDLDRAKEGLALLWVAGREPQLQLSIMLDRHEVPRDELSGNAIVAGWTKGPENMGLALATRLRAQGRGSHTFPMADGLAGGEGSHRFPLPVLPAGQYAIDVVARSARGVEAWATATITVTSEERVHDVRLARQWGEAGALIEGEVKVTTADRAGRAVEVRVVDRHGRILGRQTWRYPGAFISFSVPTHSWMPNMVGVEAVLLAGKEPISYAYAYDPYTIPKRRHDQWNFITWGRLYAGGYGAMIAEDAMREMGITSRIETTNTPWWFMTRAGMNYTPYCRSGIPNGRSMPFRDFSFSLGSRKHTVPKVDDHGILARADGCLNDEPAVSQRLRGYLDIEMDFRSHGVLAYSTGDEKLTFVSCLHPACWEKYLGYLERQYGTIDALNASWETSFNAFCEITPIIDETGYPEIEDPQDRRSVILGNANSAWACIFSPPGSTTWHEGMKNYPRWFDRRAFQYWNHAKYVERFGAEARRIDPQARSGVEGTLFGTEQDVDMIMRHTDWWVLYNNPTLEIVRSIARPGYTFGKWFGYGPSERNAMEWWWTFLRGSNCQGWFRADHFLNMRIGPGRSRAIVESGRRVIDGLGTLLNVRSRPRHDGIAMLHSFPSAQASYLEAGHSYGTYGERPGITTGDDWPIRPAGNMHVAWHRAIRSLGLQFQYVTDRMLRLGEFESDAYKVLILSQCEAIGAEEAQAIRRFVAEGGTVIADVRPGIYDGRCKPMVEGVLDDLFGVVQRGNVPAQQVETAAIKGRIGEHDVSVDLAASWNQYPEYLAWLFGDLDQLNGSRREAFQSFAEAAPKIAVNPAVEVAGGTALGIADGVPICIVNEVGQGRAVLLNFSMGTFPHVMVPQTPESCANFLAGLFSAAEVQWPMRLMDEKGRRHRNLEAVRWQVGESMEVVAVYGPLDHRDAKWRHYTPGIRRGAKVPPRQEHDQIDPVRIHLPREKYVTQVGGPALGVCREIPLMPRARRPIFLVMSDRSLPIPVLRPDVATVSPGEMLSCEVALAGAEGMHAVKISVETPDSIDAAWFQRTIIVEDGKAYFDLPIAHNERKGAWKLTARDLYTDEVVESRFIVE